VQEYVLLQGAGYPIYATGDKFRTFCCSTVGVGKLRGLGAEPQAAGVKRGLGAEPPELGNFLQFFFSKNNTFLGIFSNFCFKS